MRHARERAAASASGSRSSLRLRRHTAELSPQSPSPAAARASTSSSRLLAEAPVQPVDHLGHPLEPLGDHTQPELAEMLRLDTERAGERLYDVVRRDGTVPVDEMVQISRRETRAGRELAV